MERAASVARSCSNLSLTRSVDQIQKDYGPGHDGHQNPIRNGTMGQAERVFSATSTFLSGIMAISAAQLVGAPLRLVDTALYKAYMAWTKESFAVLVLTVTQWWAPTVVRVSGDDSMKDQLFLMRDGSLACNFPHRLILMSNHQLYTDWLYLWWIAYTNKMHGHLFIILKESLKQLPIIGWGMQFYNFIFLSRKWEQDQHTFRQQLKSLKDPSDSMWLLIFPEGTNLSAVTRDKSARWSKKTGISDMKHQLLPRSTGLQSCLQELRASTNWLYDCTVAYEGVPHGQYGQDIFTLKSSLLEGQPPKSVNMYWRRFRIGDIPYQDSEQFARWLLNRWREKDYILEYFSRFQKFPSEEPTTAFLATQGKRKPSHARTICTSVQSGGWEEFLGIFGPVTTVTGAFSNIDLTEPLDLDTMMQKVVEMQRLHLLKPIQDSGLTAARSAVRKALQAAQKRSPLPESIIMQLFHPIPKIDTQMGHVLRHSEKSETAKDVARPSRMTNRASVPTTTSVQQKPELLKQMSQAQNESKNINLSASKAPGTSASGHPAAAAQMKTGGSKLEACQLSKKQSQSVSSIPIRKQT